MNTRVSNCIAGAIAVFAGTWFFQSVPKLLVLDGPRPPPGVIAVFFFVAGAAMLAGFIIFARELRRRE
jgi:hypothetical protein